MVQNCWMVPFLAFPTRREGRAKDEKVLVIRHRDWTTPVLNGGDDGSSGDDDYEGDVPNDGDCWLQGWQPVLQQKKKILMLRYCCYWYYCY